MIDSREKWRRFLVVFEMDYKNRNDLRALYSSSLEEFGLELKVLRLD